MQGNDFQGTLSLSRMGSFPATVATTKCIHCLYDDSKLRREEEESEEGQDLATYIVRRTCLSVKPITLR